MCFNCPQERARAVMMMCRRRMCPPLVKGSLIRTIWDHCSYRSAWGQLPQSIYLPVRKWLCWFEMTLFNHLMSVVRPWMAFCLWLTARAALCSSQTTSHSTCSTNRKSWSTLVCTTSSTMRTGRSSTRIYPSPMVKHEFMFESLYKL